MLKPIKRAKELQPLSRDHHQGLLLCWKIRTGIKKGVDINRMKNYIDWFYENHLVPHFEVEEKYIFPVLGNENENIKKALAEHRRLKRLFEKKDDIKRTLNLIEEELESHIRFEERVLFNEIQAAATEDELHNITKHHDSAIYCEDWKDEFWI
ncbi:MAG: hemerythrin domain-containing protein [Bacteroidia bacterium]